MRSRLLIVLSALLITGCTATRHLTLKDGYYAPLSRLSYSPYPDLKAGIDALLPDSLFPPSHTGIKIISLRTGETLYELNSRFLFNPASNQKLFTGATALRELGENHSLVTSLWADTIQAARLYLRGGGDPLLTAADLDSIALSASTALPPDRTWTLAGDVSYFDDLSWGKGWMWDEEPDGTTGMYISPLSVNGNLVRVKVRPGMNEGDSVRVSIEPATQYVTIENSARTVLAGEKSTLTIERRWRERSNAIVISGDLLVRDSLTTAKPNVWQPEWYALTILRERLQAHGIACSRMVIDTIPGTAREVARVSRTVAAVVKRMMKVSDNLAAECLLKTTAAERLGPPGTAAGGTSIVRQFLGSVGVDTSTVVIADGSGISHYNLTSPDAVILLLAAMYDDSSHFASFFNSLPIAGVDGTIAERMKGTPAEGNLRAKTGTLSSTSALSGYVTTRDSELLAFSMVMGRFPGWTTTYRRVQDRIGAFLAGLSRQDL